MVERTIYYNVKPILESYNLSMYLHDISFLLQVEKGEISMYDTTDTSFLKEENILKDFYNSKSQQTTQITIKTKYNDSKVGIKTLLYLIS